MTHSPAHPASADGVWTHLRLAPNAAPSAPLALDAEAAILVQGGLVQWVGASADLLAEHAGLARHDGGGALVTPGLIDCHTHL
ncbi:MAG: imidazolonepropionase, partial [Polaromonas sp.]